MVRLINNDQKPLFEIQDERLIEGYSLTKEARTLPEILYELDVLFNGEVTPETIEEYTNTIVAPEGVVSVNIEFYNFYDDNAADSNSSFLKYEIEKVL